MKKLSTKKVRITLEMDAHFVSMLRATLTLRGALNMDDQPKLTAVDALGVVAYGEARGALEQEINAMTPHEWRPNIEAIHSERKVIEDGQFPIVPNFKAGDIVVIKNGWESAGKKMRVMGTPVFQDQWWVPVEDPDEEDPTFYKEACLEVKQP